MFSSNHTPTKSHKLQICKIRRLFGIEPFLFVHGVAVENNIPAYLLMIMNNIFVKKKIMNNI
jgi:hypothetical protein